MSSLCRRRARTMRPSSSAKNFPRHVRGPFMNGKKLQFSPVASNPSKRSGRHSRASLPHKSSLRCIPVMFMIALQIQVRKSELFKQVKTSDHFAPAGTLTPPTVSATLTPRVTVGTTECSRSVSYRTHKRYFISCVGSMR